MTTLRPGKRPPDDRYINREELRELIPVTDMTIARWRRNPAVAFPAPVKLGIGAAARNYWWLPDIRAWMRRREDRRQHEPEVLRKKDPP